MKETVIQALRQIEASVGEGIWGAHRGCAVIAGALLVERGLLSAAAQGEVAALVRARTSDAPKGTHEPGNRISRSEFFARVLTELRIDAAEPKELGHDVIYAANVLRALEVFAIDPWPSLLENLTALIRDVKRSGPGWITVNGTNERRSLPDAGADIGPDFWTTFSERKRPMAMELGDMQLGHVLTHGHAIASIGRFADAELVADLRLAYRKRLQGLHDASRDQRDQTPLPRRALDPREIGYWAAMAHHGDMHGHVFKYAYSFLDLKSGRISGSDLEAFGRIVWPDQRLHP